MINPFAEKYITDTKDELLIQSALQGNRKSLEELIYRHQAWIYNIALRMVFYPQEAEDVTQEVLIKILTKLSTFRGESSFRTWAYRIVVNHVLNMKKSLGEKKHFDNFNDYWRAIENTPDMDLPNQNTYSVEMKTLVNEVKVSCISGMLLCLDREQRLIYILGVIFQVTDAVGAEIMEISRDNFRQKLSRSRKQIFNFMNDKCGLMNKNNPCRCEKKTKALIDSGYVNPKNLLFNINYVHSVESVVEEKSKRLDELLDERSQKLFRENPFQEPPDFVEALKEVIDNKEFRDIFNFTN
ncbi:MAG: RNA polymerase sigma factor [Chlorobi bacterium]|nr:RNA polymerase sigma factor [Chlorobiota bacterium]MCI0715762.1 RNA polymerase sigma factor [Chlorobiota bacterium]